MPRPNPLPFLPHVLFDIDGTLTDDAGTPQIDSRYVMGNALFELFTARLVEQGMPRSEASRALHAYAEEKIFWDYDDFVQNFNFPEPEIWEALTDWHRENLHIYEDGLHLVHRLFEQGVPLHIVSNNPRIGCLLKLEAAGLGTLKESGYFREIFCSNQQYGQKHDIRFWERILSSSGLDPAQTVIVGNNLHEDYEVPSRLGFYGSFIVDRENVLHPRPSDPGPRIVRSLWDVDLPVIPAHAHLAHIPELTE